MFFFQICLKQDTHILLQEAWCSRPAPNSRLDIFRLMVGISPSRSHLLTLPSMHSSPLSGWLPAGHSHYVHPEPCLHLRMGLLISPKEGKKYNHLFKNAHIPSFIILCCHQYLTKSSSQHLFPKCKQPERRKCAVLQPRTWINAFTTDTLRHPVMCAACRNKWWMSACTISFIRLGLYLVFCMHFSTEYRASR